MRDFKRVDTNNQSAIVLYDYVGPPDHSPSSLNIREQTAMTRRYACIIICTCTVQCVSMTLHRVSVKSLLRKLFLPAGTKTVSQTSKRPEGVYRRGNRYCRRRQDFEPSATPGITGRVFDLVQYQSYVSEIRTLQFVKQSSRTVLITRIIGKRKRVNIQSAKVLGFSV